MSRQPLDPDEIPEDTTAAGLAGWIGEDIARSLMLRLAAALAAICLLAGFLSESAGPGLKSTCLGVGVAALVLLLATQLLRWSRARQWVMIGLITVTCGGLLLAVWLGSR